MTPTNRFDLEVSIMADSKSPNPFSKPREDFPLCPHRTGRWAKRVRGQLHYFGKCADDLKGEAALTKWLDQKDDLLAGRTPRAKTEGLTIGELCDRFLQSKDKQREAGEITFMTRCDYKETTDRIVAQFGKNRLVADLGSDDFEALRASIAKTWGPVALGNEIQRVRVVFKYAYDSSLIDQPMRYGPMFKRPSRKVMRLQRAKQGPKMFEAEDVLKLIAGATPQLKAMILLAVNCGFGNNDCATLPLSSLDVDDGWLDFPRPKTGIHRRCPLWPETVKAVQTVLEKRKEPKDETHAGLVFITAVGGSFWKESGDNPISKEFAKLVKAKGLQQHGRGFHSLRHTFRTIADGTRDQPAVDSIMGHADESMAARYRERIDDSRLVAVSNFVRGWLYAESKPNEAKSKAVKGKTERRPKTRPTASDKPRQKVTTAEDRPMLRIVG